ncbi:MAG TPA: DNA internalization-related competence protein ComEC/Rec2 [Gammaproteobacteria bacterium]|nr:DNA internalization-related competence protein ComEC/Rec2 [Gammaproteobacteria bacterium]
MLYSALAFLSGVCLYQYLPGMAPGACLWLFPALLLVLLPVPLLRATGMCCAGLLWIAWQGSQLDGAQLPLRLEGRDVLVRGTVQGLPEALRQQRLRFRFLVEQVETRGDWQALSLPVRVTWYRNAQTVQPGERWQFRLRLRRPRGFANPGGFDYRRWLLAQGIQATAYVRRASTARRLSQRSGQPLEQLRQRVSAHLQRLPVPESERALLRALAVGDRSGMTARQWQVLRTTGTSHLLAISGLHVGMVAGLMFFVCRKGWSLLGNLERWPAPRVAAAGAVSAALLYALLAGFQVPAQRALIMISLWMLARMWNGSVDPWRVWAIALLLVLCLDPFAVTDAGFWLSFTAVAVLIRLTHGYRGQAGRIRHWSTIQFGLLLGLAPLQWLLFQQLSLSAPVANLVAIPWISLTVVPLLLFGLLLLPVATLVGDCLLELSAHSLSLLWWLLERCAALPAGLWQPPSVAHGWMLLSALGVLVLLLPRALRLAPLGGLLLLPLGCLQPARPQPGDLWFTLLDVGQGLAAVAETHNRVLVYDSGPAFRSGFNTGAAVVAPFLVSQGYRHIDRLVISHADQDHSGGARALFERMEVRSVHAGEPGAIDWARSQQCRAGQHWTWDRVHFAYLAPRTTGEGNNGSCVLRIETAAGQVLLLPGDIERDSETRLVESHAPRLAADVLVAPHHGSRTSSGPAFTRAVRPRYVLFPVGYRNRFGFPAPEVLARYRQLGAQVLDTARSGAIRIRLEAGRGLTVVETRRPGSVAHTP